MLNGSAVESQRVSVHGGNCTGRTTTGFGEKQAAYEKSMSRSVNWKQYGQRVKNDRGSDESEDLR